MHQPYFDGQYYTPPSIKPPHPDALRLRRDASFIGTAMLVMEAAMQFLFPLLLPVLWAVGLLDYSYEVLDNFGLGGNGYLIFYGCVYAVSMSLPAVVVAFICRRRYFPLSPACPCSGTVAFCGVFTALGGCLVTSIAVNFIVSFLAEFGLPLPEFPQMMENTTTSFLLNLVVSAVLPALLEEMVFRGYVLRTLRPYGDGFAVVVSAVIFGLMHGNIIQIPFATVVGLLVGWLYVVTDNIWLAVAVHFLNNGLSVVMEYVGFSMDDARYMVFSWSVIGAVILFGAACFAVLCFRHKKVFSLRKNVSSLTLGQRLGNLFCSPTFLASIVVFVVLLVLGMVTTE